MLKIIFIHLTILTSFICQSQTVFDIDGNEYGTVAIGSQLWLTSSLKTTHFSNGDIIPTTIPPTLNVNSETAPLYQWSYNGNDSLANIYGRLYTWYVVGDSRNVCPVGWHVPSITEFNTMINYLGGTVVAGGKLKETGYDHWSSPNTAATNESGFTSVGNGNRNLVGTFNDMGIVSDMWSTTEGVNGAWDCDLHFDNATTTSNDDPKGFAFAIRCVCDTLVSITSNEPNYLEKIYIYPVPAQNKLMINTENYSSISFQIISIFGNVVVEGILNSGINELNIETLESGSYLIRFTDSVYTSTVKFVKSN